MKRFVRTENDRFFKVEGLMMVSQIQERYPTEWTVNTKVDEEGKPLPIFFFDMLYDNDKHIYPEYEDIEEAEQDRRSLLYELNAD